MRIIGRNDPCPCGSGKKFKKCCIGKTMPLQLPGYILSKKQFIEQQTGNNVSIEERNGISFGAFVDFPDWNDRSNLPKILIKPRVEDFHILHELIHLEKFFVDQYSIIACNNTSLHPLLDIFKNIPEDYVAHKIIKYQYGLDPIEKRWFAGRDKLSLPDDQIAANLVNYHAFSEFCSEFKKQFESFYKNCQKQKPTAFQKADRAITALEKMDYQNKVSYDQCADEMIKIFVPQYHGINIYLSYFSKTNSGWIWNP